MEGGAASQIHHPFARKSTLETLLCGALLDVFQHLQNTVASLLARASKDMSRKRNHSFTETSLSPDPQNAFMDTPVSAARPDEDLLEFEPDEELLCSVSDITEHLGRNITVVLETALSEIRKMVSVRIRVLKMELREKTDEIEVLKTRLEVQIDGRDPYPGGMTTEVSSVFRKADFHSGSKHNNNDHKKAKPAMPGVKKENINAICDYLMKDKNSRGAETDSDPSNPSSGSDRDSRHDPQPHSLNHLWPDSGIPDAGHGDGESDSATDDIFDMSLPSGSKRIHDYEWMTGVEYTSDLKGNLINNSLHQFITNLINHPLYQSIIANINIGNGVGVNFGIYMLMLSSPATLHVSMFLCIEPLYLSINGCEHKPYVCFLRYEGP